MATDYTGQWGTVAFDVPDFLEDARDAVNDFAELLVAGLEIVNLALEFAKAFIRGFLDPLLALIQAIIDEIVAIIRDLREIGIYITSDLALVSWPPEDLRGGFAEFERRMVARLTDRTDPTRPDISSKTKTLAFFGYLSADPSEFERVVNFILTIVRMFGLSFFPDTSALPVPVIRETLYGSDSVDVSTAFQFQPLVSALSSADGSPPQAVRVTWTTQPASQKHPLNPFPILGPSGYIVTVSTLEQGIQLQYARPKANEGEVPQPREYGAIVDKHLQPVVLHGGAEMLAFESEPFGYNQAMLDGVPDIGACQVFGMLDPARNEIIPLEDLGRSDVLGTPGDGKGEEFFLQRTFLIESDVALAQWFAGEYGATFNQDDMPHDARWEKQSDGTFTLIDDGLATHYYVRVWSVGKEIAGSPETLNNTVPKWDFQERNTVMNAWSSGQPFIVGMKSGVAAIGSPSAARKITFVNANTQDYLHALETALLVLVLARGDLPLIDELLGPKTNETVEGYEEGNYLGSQFGLIRTGMEDSRHLVKRLYPDLGELSKPEQTVWRTSVFEAIRQLALDIYEHTGPMPDTEAAVVAVSDVLRTATWKDVLDAADENAGSAYQDEADGLGIETLSPMFTALDPDNLESMMSENLVAPNLWSTGISARDVDELLYLEGDNPVVRLREGEFAMWDGGDFDIVYEESDPVLVALLLDVSPEGLRATYEQFIDADGALLIPEEYRTYFEEVQEQKRRASSGDRTPVFCVNVSRLISYAQGVDRGHEDWPSVLFTRGLLRGLDNGVLYQQAATVLRVATAAHTRAPEDGEWIAIRLFDALPELEVFLDALENWVSSLANAIQSMADAIIAYIEFIQAQIVELQQLIRRINAMIQSILSFAVALPQFNGLMLFSDGTDGVMTDLVAADNKPSDSPLSYGGGVALVVPFGPSFIFDIIALTLGSPDPDAMTTLTQAPDAVGIEQIEPAPGAAPTNEPDVL